VTVFSLSQLKLATIIYYYSEFLRFTFALVDSGSCPRCKGCVS